MYQKSLSRFYHLSILDSSHIAIKSQLLSGLSLYVFDMHAILCLVQNADMALRSILDCSVLRPEEKNSYDLVFACILGAYELIYVQSISPNALP